MTQMVRDYRTQYQVEQIFVDVGDFMICLKRHHHYATENGRGTADELHIVVYDRQLVKYLVLM